jgi:hypothetical protein
MSRMRTITKLNRALDLVETLIADSNHKPSVLKAAVARAEIYAALLRREDAAKERKAQVKAVASTPPEPDLNSIEGIRAEIARLKAQQDKNGGAHVV